MTGAMSAQERAAQLVRPEIRALSAYAVAKAQGLVKLDAMENPYALPVATRERIANAVRDLPINRYPAGGGEPVKRALREAYGIDDDLAIMLGNGSDELIQIVTYALARPNAVMAVPQPSFVMYRMNAIYSGMRFVGVDLGPDFGLDLRSWREVIARERPALAFIAYPNNPTGNLFADEDVEEIVATTPGLVVIDEAYHAFAQRSFVDRMRAYPNVIVLRTLSKLGMAGLRLGYAIGAPEWIGEFEKLRPPYNVNAITQAIVPMLLADGTLLEQQAAAIRDERARLGRELARIRGVTVYPSDANFIVIRVADAPAWFNGLAKAGILVKNLHGWHPLVANCLRLTVGTPDENDLLLTALRKLT